MQRRDAAAARVVYVSSKLLRLAGSVTPGGEGPVPFSASQAYCESKLAQVSSHSKDLRALLAWNVKPKRKAASALPVYSYSSCSGAAITEPEWHCKGWSRCHAHALLCTCR